MAYDITKAREHFGAKQSFTTGPHELLGMIDRKEEVVIVDVRFPTDFRKAHIPGAVSLPKGKWQTGAGLSKEKPNVLYCYNQQCHLAAEAALELLAQGYPVVEMEGGFATWEASGAPVEATQSRAAA